MALLMQKLFDAWDVQPQSDNMQPRRILRLGPGQSIYFVALRKVAPKHQPYCTKANPRKMKNKQNRKRKPTRAVVTVQRQSTTTTTTEHRGRSE